MPAKRSASNDLSELEQRRLDNIARNELFLSSLGLDDVKIEQEKVNKKASQKGDPSSAIQSLVFTYSFIIIGVFKKKDLLVPTRRSGRVTTEKLKSELDQLISNEAGNEEIILKRKELEEFQAAHAKQDYEAIIESENAPAERLLEDVLLDSPINFGDGEVPPGINSWVSDHSLTKLLYLLLTSFNI